jgi:hypothetical protein
MTTNLDEIARYMKMSSLEKDAQLSKRTRELLETARKAVRPERIWKRFTITDNAIASGFLRFDGSASILRHLEKCHAAYLVCGTLGAGFDALQRTRSVSSACDALILQAIGAALTEELMNKTEEDIRRELKAGETITSRYSPGYGDFPLEAQRAVLELLDTHRRIGVALTDNLLMVPSKSVSAVIGVRMTASADHDRP